MRTYSYSRVSNDERSKDQRQKQEAQGELNQRLEAQQNEHRSYCASNSLPAPLTFADICSGSDEKQKDRKSQIDLLSKIAPGDMLIVSKVDRWSRDLVWAVGSIRDLVKRDITVRFTSDAPRDAKSDDSMIGIMAWAADQERKRIKERTVGARVRKRTAGYWAGATCPVGYSVGEDGRLAPNQDADAVRAIYRLCIEGNSLHAISRRMRVDHARKTTRWMPNQVRTILKSRVYLGEVRPSKDAQWVKGCHAPIITETDYHRAQSGLAGRLDAPRGGGVESWTAALIGRDLMTCARCGYRVSCHRSNVEVSGERKAFDYYVCSHRSAAKAEAEGSVKCGGVTAKVQLVDAMLRDSLAARITELRSLILTNEASVSVEVPRGFDHAGELRRLEGKRSRLVDAYTEGDITKEAYKTSLAKIDRDIGDVKVAIENLSDAERAALPESRVKLASYLDEVGEAFATASASDVRALLRELASAIVLQVEAGAAKRSRYHPNQVALRVTWREPGELLRSAARAA